MAKILILCPTFDHVDALYMSISSVRAQTFHDWQMVVIGDGSPERTSTILSALSAEDERISYRRFPKGARFGEEYRDIVIRECKSEVVCHLSDDDLWAPNHLDVMVELLAQHDWACQAPMRADRNGQADWLPVNHATPPIRQAVAGSFGVSVGINYAAYRTEAYQRLSHGWFAAPWELGPSDRFNWSKFMADSSVSVASQAITTALKFPSHVHGRAKKEPQDRAAELGVWLAQISKPGLVQSLSQQGHVGSRFRGLFLQHGCWGIDNLEEALARCGMQADEKTVTPLPGCKDTPMIVPLTQSQLGEVHDALMATNPLSPLVEGLPDGSWERLLGKPNARWITLMFAIGIEDIERADQLYRGFKDQLGANAHYWSTWFVLAMRSERFDQAPAIIDRARRLWPNADWLDILESRLHSR